MFALLSNIIDLFVKNFFVVKIHCASLLHVIFAAPDTLDLKLILIAKFEKVLLTFFEAERSRNFVIDIQFNSLEDDISQVVNDIAKSIDKITSAIDKALSLVQKFTSIASHYNEIAHVIDFEVSHNICQFEVGDLLLWLEDLLFNFLFLVLYIDAFISA